MSDTGTAQPKLVTEMPTNQMPCQGCPWRIPNWGKPTKGGFYTKRNLLRLWNSLRRGGRPQSCHMTDTSHPDHLAAGARDRVDGPHECPGSLVVVQRELNRLLELSDGDMVDGTGVARYLAETKGTRGLTKGRNQVLRPAPAHAPPVRAGPADGRHEPPARRRLDRTAPMSKDYRSRSISVETDGSADVETDAIEEFLVHLSVTWDGFKSQDEADGFADRADSWLRRSRLP